MKYLITGAGQIGSQLALDLSADGHDVNVLRRSTTAVPGARMFTGDVANRAVLAQAATGCAAIFHCTHAPYDSRAWRELLPPAEQAVMDVGADLGIPVIFPESMYAYAGNAAKLSEGATPNPVEGKGQIRAELLAAREAHQAIAMSIVAADLIGPTATSAGSVLKATLLDPISKPMPAIVLADPDCRHSVTYIPDLTRAMRLAAESAHKLTAPVLHAPTDAAHTLREWAEAAAAQSGKKSRIWGVPPAPIRFAGRFNRMCFELAEIAPLWYSECILGPSSLPLEPTPWQECL